MHHVAIDDYVLDVLLPDLVGHDRSPAAFLIYLVLWTQLFRSEERSTAVSLQKLSELSGLSKSAVQQAVRVLRQRGLIKVRKIRRRPCLNTSWSGTGSPDALGDDHFDKRNLKRNRECVNRNLFGVIDNTIVDRPIVRNSRHAFESSVLRPTGAGCRFHTFSLTLQQKVLDLTVHSASEYV